MAILLLLIIMQPIFDIDMPIFDKSHKTRHSTRYGNKCVRAEKQKQRTLKRTLLSSTPVDEKNALGPKDLPSLWFRTNMLHNPNVPVQKAWNQMGQAFRTNCMKDAITLKELRLNKTEGADPYDFWGLESLCSKCNESQCYCDYYNDYMESYYGFNDDEYNDIRSEPKVEPKVKKTPPAPKQYEFGFEFILNGEKCSTTYSSKNQFLLMRAWNEGYYWYPISHEIQKGPKKGTTVLHTVNFSSKDVMTQTGVYHKLLMTEKQVMIPPVSPIIISKKFDWHMKSKIAKLTASRIRSDDFDISDCSSISSCNSNVDMNFFL